MRKEFYVEQILQNILLPFSQTAFPDGYFFQQDNDPKHKSKCIALSYLWLKVALSNFCLSQLSLGKLAMQFLQDNEIHYWPTPAESPDMNPIELIWHELKNLLQTVVKPINKEELVAGI